MLTMRQKSSWVTRSYLHAADEDDRGGELGELFVLLDDQVVFGLGCFERLGRLDVLVDLLGPVFVHHDDFLERRELPQDVRFEAVFRGLLLHEAVELGVQRLDLLAELHDAADVWGFLEEVAPELDHLQADFFEQSLDAFVDFVVVREEDVAGESVLGRHGFLHDDFLEALDGVEALEGEQRRVQTEGELVEGLLGVLGELGEVEAVEDAELEGVGVFLDASLELVGDEVGDGSVLEVDVLLVGAELELVVSRRVAAAERTARVCAVLLVELHVAAESLLVRCALPGDQLEQRLQVQRQRLRVCYLVDVRLQRSRGTRLPDADEGSDRQASEQPVREDGRRFACEECGQE